MLSFLFGPKVESISTTTLAQKKQKERISILDVREPHEFRSGHISGAKNVPLSALAHHITSLNKNEPYYVICQSGMRSNVASKKLKKAGFTHIINVKGGMSTWTGPIK